MVQQIQQRKLEANLLNRQGRDLDRISVIDSTQPTPMPLQDSNVLIKPIQSPPISWQDTADKIKATRKPTKRAPSQLDAIQKLLQEQKTVK